MAISISTNFKLGAAMPLDARQKVDTIENRNAIDTGLRYDGLKTYVVEDGRTYVLKGGITNDCWVAEDVITNDMIESLADISSSMGQTWGYIPFVKSDGGVELGQYVDFHMESADEIDRAARIRIYDDSGTPRFKFEGSSSGSLAHLTVKNLSAEQYHGTYYGTFGYPAEITLNGTTYTYNGNSASAEEFAAGLTFYAPKSAGTEGYVLLADSAGIPEWTDTLPYTTKFKTSESGVSLSLGNFYSAFTTMANAVTTLTNTVTLLESRIEALETASE